MEEIGERIYEIRRERGLSQEYLAEKLGVSRQTLSKWENNSAQPSEQNVKVMCEFLQVSRDYFFPAAAKPTAVEVRSEEAVKISEKNMRVRKVLIIGAVIAGALMLICTCITAVCGIIILTNINSGLIGGGGDGEVIDFWALVSGMREYNIFLTSLIIAGVALVAGLVFTVLIFRERRCNKSV